MVLLILDVCLSIRYEQIHYAWYVHHMRVMQFLGKDVSGSENIHIKYDLKMKKYYEA